MMRPINAVLALGSAAGVVALVKYGPLALAHPLSVALLIILITLSIINVVPELDPLR